MPVGAFGLGKLLDFRNPNFSGATPPSFFFGTGTMVGFIAGGPGQNASQPGLEIPQLMAARNYGILTTHGHWTDATGGGGVQQRFTTGDRTFTRLPTSADTWANWREQAYTEAVDAKANTAALTGAGLLVQQLSQPAGSDFNNAGATQFELKTGISSTLNKPAGAGNGWVNVLGMPRDAGNASQLATGVTAEGVWYRRKENAAYKEWRQLAFTDNAAFTGPLSATGDISVLGTTGEPKVRLSGNAGTNRYVRYDTAGVQRFQFGVSSAFESGNNAGSNFYVNRFADDGTVLGNTLTVERASGDIALWGRVQTTGPLKAASYTLSTLPSAAANNGYIILVTNASGGPKYCASNGTTWQILNTTTTVS